MTKPRTHSSKKLIDRVRKAALALPGTTEKISHGEPSFFCGRMFITVDNHHHGSAHLAIWCRAEAGVQPSFVEASPEHYFVPAYLGHQGWIGVCLDTGLEWSVIARFVEEAWKEAAAKRPPAQRRTKSRA